MNSIPLFSPPLATIACFQWCHPVVNQRPDTELLADVFWWERRDAVPEKINNLMQSYSEIPQDECFFCLAYAAMSVGELELFDFCANKISTENNGQILRKWLEIEIEGRKKNYANQARLVSQIIKKEGTMPDWCATACFASLNHSDVDPKPLLDVLTKQSIASPLASLVVARLLAAAAQPEQAVKVIKTAQKRWPDTAALWWFEALVSIQIGNTKETLYLIETAQEKGLVCLTTLRIWLDLLVSTPQTIAKEKLHTAYLKASQYVAKDVRQSGELASYRIIQSWIEGDLKGAYQLLTQHHQFQNMEERSNDRAAQVFMRYAVFLCVAWQHNQHLYQVNQMLPSLYVLGESHSLTSSNLIIQWQNTTHKVKTCFMMGIKMYHLADGKPNRYKSKLCEHLAQIENEAPILFTIGEIDSRPDEGIWKTHRKTGRPIKVLVKNTVEGYFQYLDAVLQNSKNITIAGVPAPKYSLEGKRDPGNKEAFLSMLHDVNEKMKAETLKRGWSFLDIYAATVGSDGRSNEKWHLDGWHLQPIFYANAHNWLLSVAR